MSDCVRVSGLLPFLLNGTLEDVEKEAVRAHLLECEECRRELGGTARVWELYSLHPEPEALTARAYGVGTDEELSAAIDAHVEVCASCREELDLARESRATGATAVEATREPAPVLPFSKPEPEVARPAPTAWRTWAAAAMVLAAAGIAALTWSELLSGRDRWEDERARLERRIEELERSGETPTVEKAPPETATASEVEAERAARLEAERVAAEAAEAAADARARIARLEDRVAALTRPQINVPTHELFPTGTVVRSAPGDPAAISVGNDDVALNLILATEDRSDYPDYRLAVYAEDGTLLWETAGLDRQPAGDFSIHLPAGTLPPGRVSLRLYGLEGADWKPIEAYKIQVDG